MVENGGGGEGGKTDRQKKTGEIRRKQKESRRRKKNQKEENGNGQEEKKREEKLELGNLSKSYRCWCLMDCISCSLPPFSVCLGWGGEGFPAVQPLCPIELSARRPALRSAHL